MPELAYKPIDREKVIAVIQAEHNLIDGALVEGTCESPGHCAVGALLYAAGMSNAELNALSGAPAEWEPGGNAALLMLEEYGLDRAHAHQIVSANDNVIHSEQGDDEVQASRRAMVIETVHRLADRQASRPDDDARECMEFNARNTPGDTDDF